MNYRWEARWLAHQLGLYLHPLAQTRGGMAILTRGPISAVRIMRMPNAYFNGLLAVKWRGIWIASSHLSDSHYRKSEIRRLREVQWLHQHFRPLGPAIWAGDWNSMSHLDRRRKSSRVGSCEGRRRLASCLMEEARWVDAHEGVRQSTWLPAPKHRVERIDRIYVRPRKNWKILRRRILKARHFPFLKGHWPTGRDHALLLADLSLSLQA